MKVRVSASARMDIARLRAFLEEKSPSAADRALDAIEAALFSLEKMADRGFHGPREGTRQLFVPFGQAGYIMQYLVEGQEVTVLRIFHALEER